MINLMYQNENVYVWNVEDWKKLRTEHRIIGNFFGALPQASHQISFNGFPLVLLEEEVSLLLEKKIGKLVSYKSLKPSNESVEKYNDFMKTNKKEQEEHIMTERKRNITQMIDKIMEGKRKKLSLTSGKVVQSKEDPQNDSELDREAVLKAELERVEQTPLNHSLVPTFIEDPWITNEDLVEIDDWSFPSSSKQELRYKVFKDLWGKGYYLTCGQKFGGDFLVYPGDPVQFHAHFIVLCKDHNSPINFVDLSSHGRVGSSSRKTFVIASSAEDGTLLYTSFQFIGMPSCIM